MKSLLLFAYLISFSSLAIAQTTPPLSALSSVRIRLPKTKTLPPAPNPVFKHFIVIDERPDTARIGLHTYNPVFGPACDRQLVFDQPTAIAIATYLNQFNTSPEGPYTALVVLRNLWLSDAHYGREEKLKDPDRLHERTHIRFRAEIYVITDSNQYTPVLRFDTLYTYKRFNYYSTRSEYDIWDEDLPYLLDNLADTARDITIRKIAAHNRTVSGEDIRQSNLSRFTIPISDNTTLVSGVYTNFEEFRNNAPSLHDFEVKTNGGERLLYIKEPGGGSYYSHDAWGYCDGTTIYIMRNGLLCPAWKEGKAFYFYAGSLKETKVPPGLFAIGRPAVPDEAGGGMFNSGNVIRSGQMVEHIIRSIYTIDMDTGAIY